MQTLDRPARMGKASARVVRTAPQADPDRPASRNPENRKNKSQDSPRLVYFLLASFIAFSCTCIPGGTAYLPERMVQLPQPWGGCVWR